jgi:thioredoxin 1
MLQIYYFTATWCGPCRAFGPIVDQVKSEFPNVNITKLDVDSGIRSKHEINSVPTLVFEKGGMVVDVRTGAMSKSALETIIRSHA